MDSISHTTTSLRRSGKPRLSHTRIVHATVLFAIAKRADEAAYGAQEAAYEVFLSDGEEQAALRPPG
jgi:hypothetical protein